VVSVGQLRSRDNPRKIGYRVGIIVRKFSVSSGGPPVRSSNREKERLFPYRRIFRVIGNDKMYTRNSVTEAFYWNER